MIALIKPQFEAGRLEVRRGKGVIRDPEVHRQVLLDVLDYAAGAGWQVRGLIARRFWAPRATAEFLAWLQPGGAAGQALEPLIQGVLA